MPAIKLIAYGIAREILNGKSMDITLTEGYTLGHLRQYLVRHYPDFVKLQYLKFAVYEEYQEDDYILNEGQEVVIIPPVSGG